MGSLDLRNYQKELAAVGLRGENCIVVAPTGCGKTHVAIKICKKHVEKNPNSKVVFLVPVKTLVQQQYDLFKQFIDDDQYPICQMSGDTDTSIPQSITFENHTISLMTPQILVNLLKNSARMKIEKHFSDQLKNCYLAVQFGDNSSVDKTEVTILQLKKLRLDEIPLDKISLLVFDECHNAFKKKPYNVIMNLYLDIKLTPAISHLKLPQVVGMTASPGLRDVINDQDATEKIKTLMANLDVTIPPVQVVKNIEELRSYQNEAKYELETVRRDPGNQFSVQVNEIMSCVESRIKADIERYKSVLPDGVCISSYPCRGNQRYESCINALREQCKLVENPEASQRFMTYTRQLLKYNESLILNDHITSGYARKFLMEKLFLSPPRNEVEKSLFEIFERYDRDINEAVASPLLKNLKLMLMRKSKELESLSCIIFSKTRRITEYLSNILREDPTLHSMMNHNTKRLTGSGASAADLGMTKAEQLDTLRFFREGKCKDIVATSVAEEGLDIGACNLIIDYNYSSDGVGFTQRKGRARAKNSRFVLLAYDDSPHVRKMRENLELDRLTRKTLFSIQEMDQVQLKLDIASIQKIDKNLRDLTPQARPVTVDDESIYTLKCEDCKYLATTSNYFRHIHRQHRVVIDPDFFKQAFVEEIAAGMEDLRFGDEEVNIGKIYCGNDECRKQWGMLMRYKGCKVPVIHIKNFLITNNKGYKQTKKKWKDAPFPTLDDEITDVDLREILERASV